LKQRKLCCDYFVQQHYTHDHKETVRSSESAADNFICGEHRCLAYVDASCAVSFNYQYNDANQRTRVTYADGSYWLYDYDTLGQLISGKHYWSDGTPVAGQQHEYAYDDSLNYPKRLRQ
jgi:YD repeat-containing protein